MPFPSFENLIRNELPTLDLSFPTHNKNHLAYSYTNAYKSESSVSAHATADDRKLSDDLNKSLKHSQNVSENLNASFTLSSDISSSKKNHQKINNGLFKVDRESEATKQYDLNKSNNSQMLPIESDLKESSSNNTNISVTVPSNVQENENYVIKNDGNKLSEKYGENIQNLPKVSLQEIAVPTHDRPLIKNLNEGKESKADVPVEIVKENKVSESDVEKSISGFQQVTETPLIIDLDAAWKRKSSLKSSTLTSPFSKLPIEITSKEITQAESSQLQNVEHDLFVSSSSKSNLCENFNVDLSHVGGQQSIEQQRNHQESKGGDSENSKEIEFYHRIEPQNNSEVKKLQEIEPQGLTERAFPEEAGTVSADISKSIDSADAQKKALNDQKPVHEDSLSELSEIHLSCGSEQEQQKEDSDNW
ncbi:hypothetical protein HNY73_007916 [Argiope bruennichi]|uniref:Uncharacterized protein n=2 Tax=Argiope bruennichi TaxID=94029 RepID=A0A8T0F9N6_ARGBR|nr:hypothetical protein HNY73_007916 [Argiope bruennichi]